MRNDIYKKYSEKVFNKEENFEKIKQGKTLFISDEYFNEILRVYPKLEDRLRSMFHRPKNEQ